MNLCVLCFLAGHSGSKWKIGEVLLCDCTFVCTCNLCMFIILSAVHLIGRVTSGLGMLCFEDLACVYGYYRTQWCKWPWALSWAGIKSRPLCEILK